MLPEMRPKPLLIPLAVLSPLVFASPAMAADVSVSVVDFSFTAKQVNVGVGEKVTWSFDAAGHTTTSDRSQPEAWDSGVAVQPAGATFEHTFDTPGRFTYYCRPHASFMKGAVVVGTDEHKKSQSKFSQSRRGSTVTYNFTLVEAAKVSIKLQGEAKRSASSKRLGPGKHSIKLKNMEPGKYNGTATFTDDFGKKSVVKISTVVR
jgi:plastocyanin